VRLSSQYQLPGCGGFAVTDSAFSAAALSVMLWSKDTPMIWPTPKVRLVVGAGISDG
jgi:hypothetical protein